MKKSLLFVGVFLILLIGVVSAYSIDSYFSPSDILENEWFVFGGVFGIVFGIVYMALSSFFTKKKKGYYFGGDQKVLENKSAIGVISMIIALFSAAAFVQQDLVSGIFGQAITAWVFLFTFVFMIILFIPFYKLIKKNTGSVPANIIFFALIWAVIKFGFDPYNSEVFYNFNVPYQYLEFYDIFASSGFLYLVLIILIAFSFIKKAFKK